MGQVAGLALVFLGLLLWPANAAEQTAGNCSPIVRDPGLKGTGRWRMRTGLRVVVDHLVLASMGAALWFAHAPWAEIDQYIRTELIATPLVCLMALLV